MNRFGPSVALFACALSLAAQTIDLRPRPARPGTFALVGGATPFSAGCSGSPSGTNYPNAPVEPFVAVDPANPRHLVAAWQQDRWTDGGSNGNVSAVSMNGGGTWTTSLARFSACAGGIYQRASDPWVAISPDGTAYQIALGLNNAGAVTAVLVSRSADGGFTWGAPSTLIDDPKGGDDKETITADPNDSHYIYAVWDRSGSNDLAAWFSRTTDGGATWETARPIYDPGAYGFTTVHQLVVLPDSTLLDIFVLTFDKPSGQTPGASVAVMRSTDHGVTWTAPAMVAANLAINTVNAKTQALLRTGAGIPSSAVDPVSGTIYIAWSDARFSNSQRDGIAFIKSTDGGITWSTPVQVNRAPNVQAFTPAVAAGPGGSVAVTYFDFRQDTGAENTLLASYWRIVSPDGGNTWRETPVAGPFDILSAPVANGMPFIGDYQGLVATGDLFLSFYVTTNSGNAANPSSVFANSEMRAGDTRSNLVTEVNLHPRPVRGAKTEPRSKSR